MVAEDTAELIAHIKAMAIVHGRVTLASGRTADYYVDMRRVTLDGVAAPIVGRVMRALVADWDFEAVGGLTLGADPVATAMLHAAAAAARRICGSQAGQGPRPAATHRGITRGRPTRACGGGHQYDGWLSLDRRRGFAGGRSTGDRSGRHRRPEHRRQGGRRGGRAGVPLGDLCTRPWFGVRPTGTLPHLPVRVNGLSWSKT